MKPLPLGPSPAHRVSLALEEWKQRQSPCMCGPCNERHSNTSVAYMSGSKSDPLLSTVPDPCTT